MNEAQKSFHASAGINTHGMYNESNTPVKKTNLGTQVKGMAQDKSRTGGIGKTVSAMARAGEKAVVNGVKSVGRAVMKNFVDPSINVAKQKDAKIERDRKSGKLLY